MDGVIHFWEMLGDQVRDRSPEELESLIEVNYVMHVKSTCSKLQYVPDLISVACPKTELSVSGKFSEIR